MSEALEAPKMMIGTQGGMDYLVLLMAKEGVQVGIKPLVNFSGPSELFIGARVRAGMNPDSEVQPMNAGAKATEMFPSLLWAKVDETRASLMLGSKVSTLGANGTVEGLMNQLEENAFFESIVGGLYTKLESDGHTADEQTQRQAKEFMRQKVKEGLALNGLPETITPEAEEAITSAGKLIEFPGSPKPEKEPAKEALEGAEPEEEPNPDA